MQKRLALLFLITFLFVACTNAGKLSPTATVQVVGPITLGIISGSSSAESGRLSLIADYLACELKEYGVNSGQVRVANSVEEMAGWLAAGQVDLYFDSVYPALLASEKSGAELILRSWQYSSPEVQSVIFASSGSGLQRLSDLPGKMLVMNAPYSTTGFFLPAATLIKDGLVLSGKKNYSDPVSQLEIGFWFSGSDENTLQAVLSGKAVAGVVDNYYFDVAFPPEATQKLVELARTEGVPRQVVVARPGLDEQYLASLIKILTQMHETESGRAALDSFQTSRFDLFPAGAESVRRMQSMLTTIKNIALP